MGRVANVFVGAQRYIAIELLVYADGLTNNSVWLFYHLVKDKQRSPSVNPMPKCRSSVGNI